MQPRATIPLQPCMRLFTHGSRSCFARALRYSACPISRAFRERTVPLIVAVRASADCYSSPLFPRPLLPLLYPLVFDTSAPCSIIQHGPRNAGAVRAVALPKSGSQFGRDICVGAVCVRADSNVYHQPPGTTNPRTEIIVRRAARVSLGHVFESYGFWLGVWVVSLGLQRNVTLCCFVGWTDSHGTGSSASGPAPVGLVRRPT